MKIQKTGNKKFPKGVDSAFVDSIASLTVDELKSKIVNLQLRNKKTKFLRHRLNMKRRRTFIMLLKNSLS